MLRKTVDKSIKLALDLTVARSTIRQARQLAQELDARAYAIPQEELNNFQQKAAQFCLARGYSQQYTQEWMCHIYRVVLSLKELDLIIPDNREFSVVEMGSESVISDLLKDRFPNAKFLNTSGDLRWKWEFPDEYADLVVSMEVVEHLTDPEEGLYLDGFYKIGLRSALRQAHRVLKKGGKLFLTTPNAASIYCLVKILAGNSAWSYSTHVREYTLDEITAELIQAKFEIEKAEVVNCITSTSVVNYAAIYRLLLEYGKQTENRGDDIFITAGKS